jgi:hypothetical protein
VGGQGGGGARESAACSSRAHPGAKGGGGGRAGRREGGRRIPLELRADFSRGDLSSPLSRERRAENSPREQSRCAVAGFRRRVAGLSRMRFFVALRANERIIVAFEGISRP